jgi:hypothetical protein
MALKKFLLKPATHKETEAKLLEATQILKRLLETSTHWQKHFGATNRNEMLRWEKKAFDFINENIVEVEIDVEPKILID